MERVDGFRSGIHSPFSGTCAAKAFCEDSPLWSGFEPHRTGETYPLPKSVGLSEISVSHA